MTSGGQRGAAAAAFALALLASALCARLSELGPGHPGPPEDLRAALCADLGRLPAATALLCGGRIDVNRATEAELALLPGIGPARAKAIAASRRADGPFRDVEDLDRVPGIGAKTVERLRAWIEADGVARPTGESGRR